MEPQFIQQSVRLEIKKPVYSITPKYVWGMTLIAWEIHNIFSSINFLAWFTILYFPGAITLKHEKQNWQKLLKLDLRFPFIAIFEIVTIFVGIFFAHKLNKNSFAIVLYYKVLLLC